MPVQLQRYAFDGINRDLPPDRVVNQWTAGTGVQFRRGFGKATKGDLAIFGTTAGALNGPDFLLNAWDGTDNFWLYGATDGVGVTDGASHKVITPTVFTTPLLNDAWTGGILNGVPFLNYNENQAAFWGKDFGTPTVMAVMADAPECKAMRPYRFGLVAMDCEDSSHATIPTQPTTVAWSKFVDPGAVPSAVGDWTPSASNQAGFTELGPDEGRVIDGIQFRDDFLIGTTRGLWVMSLVGGNDVMAFRKLYSTGGVLARNCMAEVDGNVFVLTSADLVVTDGNTVRSAINDINRKWLFDQIGDNASRAFLAFNEAERELWIAVPVGSDAYAKDVLVLDIDNGQFGIRNSGDISHAAPGRNSVAIVSTWAGVLGTWAAQTRIWNQQSVGSVSDVLVWGDGSDGGQLYQADGTTDTTRTFLLERQSLDFGNPGKVKTVTRVWPTLESDLAGEEVTVRVGTQNVPDDPVAWSNPVTMLTQTEQKADVFQTGRYLSFRFTSAKFIGLTGFSVEYSERGRF